jgi:beta-lactamase superfamily II metal-dependent hydrolase
MQKTSVKKLLIWTNVMMHSCPCKALKTALSVIVVIFISIAVASVYMSYKPLIWTMINVNYSPQQGDAHLIQARNGKNILIDTGHLDPARKALVPFLQSKGIKKIDTVFITHPHKDHYLGILAILESGIPIETVYMNDIARKECEVEMPWGCDYEEIVSYKGMLKNNQVKVLEAKAGTLFDLGIGSSLKILYAFDGLNTPVGLTDINDMSYIMLLKHGFNSALFTGDLNAKLGEYLAKESKDLKVDILKLPHHGTEGAAPDAFYAAVSPKDVLVPSPALLWCSSRSARMKSWVESHKTPTYVNGFSGYVTVKMGLFGYQIEAERPQTRLPSPECPVQ